MHAVATAEAAPHFWSEEPSELPGRRRIRARVGGLHCSLCTGTIEKALSRLPGVAKVAMSLTHEQALIEYDPSIARAEDLLQTLMDIGYTVSDPRKLRPYDEEERAPARSPSGSSLASVATSCAWRSWRCVVGFSISTCSWSSARLRALLAAPSVWRSIRRGTRLSRFSRSR